MTVFIFQDRRFQPLTHSSAFNYKRATALKWVARYDFEVMHPDARGTEIPSDRAESP